MSTYQHIDTPYLATRIADGGSPADFIRLGLQLAWQERSVDIDPRMKHAVLRSLVGTAELVAKDIAEARRRIERRAQQAMPPMPQMPSAHSG